jgi:hypothetical protein
MKSKYFSIVLFILFSHTIYSQNSSKNEYYNGEFNWKIVIPENFQYINEQELNRLQEKGEEAIEKTFGEDVTNQSKKIFAFNSGKFNYFESSHQPFDIEIDGDYITTCKGVNSIVYETINTQMPGSKIDTLSSKEIINNLEFQKFNIKVSLPNGLVMNMIMYSRLFDKKELSVNIIYVDEKKGQLMLESWRNSTFSE